jgi:TonB family protein
VQTHNKEKTDQFVDSKYLSAVNSMVDRETKARVVDKMKYGSKGLEGKHQDQEETAPTNPTQLDKIKFSDLAITDFGKNGFSKFKKQKKKGLKNHHRTTHKDTTSNNDHLENVALGDFTRLNTQEYEFYGFYHRIREKLEQFWGSNLRSEAEKLYKEGRRIPANQNHVTAVLITLNDRGEIVNVRVKATSGIRELDEAAIDSFNQAGPFPNPPKKMLKSGRATIRWDFVVNS